jgi:hypothetical protein
MVALFHDIGYRTRKSGVLPLTFFEN